MSNLASLSPIRTQSPGVVRGNAARTAGLLLALAGTLSLALALLWAAPAHAHAQLLQSDPEDGAEVAEAPEEILLTFNENIEQIGADVVITDADGTDVHDGDPQIAGPELTQALTADRPAGTYTVQWRVVSADGHPVSGEFTFDAAEATGGAGGSADEEAADEEPAPEEPADDPAAGAPDEADEPAGDQGQDGSTDGTEDGAAEPVEPADPEVGDEQPAGSTFPWGLVFALAGVGVVLALVVRARRQLRDREGPAATGEAGPDERSLRDEEDGDPKP